MDSRIKLWSKEANEKSTARYILEWIQKNPRRSLNTTSNQIAEWLKLERCPKTENTIRQELQKLVRKNVIKRYGTKFKGDYYINYCSKEIPDDIFENGPKEEKIFATALREKVKAKEQKEKEVDEVTEKLWLPKEQRDNTINTDDIKPEVVDKPVEKQEGEVESSSDASEENTVNVPVEIKSTENGLSISINLNITINK